VGEAAIREGEDGEVAGIAVDSRRVRPGDVFFALPGASTDGRRHAADALTRGARAVVTPGARACDPPPAALVRTATPRRLLGHAAARLAGDPSAAMTLV